ncbi:MAG: AbrB/MazE/SpoVT family DNA-binding domain-containing protein [Oscillospiraceae bacterium]|nr:AbrB/MazE/SpoVT family DNA-binding domain-containing protein [Oscillospiraceae bacterium]
MFTAKIFQNGNEQDVRLPKECSFSEDEVVIRPIEKDVIMIYPRSRALDLFSEGINEMPEDYISAMEEYMKMTRPGSEIT